MCKLKRAVEHILFGYSTTTNLSKIRMKNNVHNASYTTIRFLSFDVSYIDMFTIIYHTCGSNIILPKNAI